MEGWFFASFLTLLGREGGRKEGRKGGTKHFLFFHFASSLGSNRKNKKEPTAVHMQLQ